MNPELVSRIIDLRDRGALYTLNMEGRSLEDVTGIPAAA